jgi:tRNA (guanine37-N1)-methyltransferase
LFQLNNSYDIVGSIAIIRVPEKLKGQSRNISKAIMNTHKQVKSVWLQISSVFGDYRLRELEFVSGEKTTNTVYKEYGCTYKTDLRKVYFSPRLSYERLRIAKLIQGQEVILNMFSGVGCFSIAISKHSEPKKIYSIDVNSMAFKYLQENIRINRAEKIVIPFVGDAKKVIEEKLKNSVDRVLMPLPKKAYEYLDYALFALKLRGGWIHYYDFVYSKKKENAVQKIKAKITQKMRRLCTDFQVEFGRVVRSIGPHWYQVVLDVKVEN